MVLCRGRDSLLLSYWQQFSYHRPGCYWFPFTPRGNYLLMFNFMPSRTLRSSPANLLFSHSVQPVLLHEAIPSGTGLDIFFCWTSWGFSQPVSADCQCPSEWQYNSVVHQSLHQCFISSTYLPTLPSVPLFRQSTMLLNNTGASISPWGAPLQRNLQLEVLSLIIILWAWQVRQFSAYLIVHLSSLFVSAFP